MRRWLVLLVLASACGDDGGMPSKTAYFDLDGELAGSESYWNLPFPSDLRLRANGSPDLDAFPNPRNVPILRALLSVADERRGWPTMPIAFVRFTAPVPPRVITEVIAADDDAAVLIDIDPTSPEVGTRFPIVAQTLAKDPYVPDDVVVFAPRPGIVLRANTRYAYVIRQGFAPGFEPAPAFAELAAGKSPSGARGAAAKTLYEPLWSALDGAGIDKDDALVATVFTTGDEVARLRARSEAVRAAEDLAIENLTLVGPSGGAGYEGFCALTGTIAMPQYQKGEPPFDSEGRFVLDANDAPMKQSVATIPLAITIPKGTMPADGWPLYQWIHGSGGASISLVDRGRVAVTDGDPEPGKGPGYVVAQHGIAAVTSAMPVNPERLPNASDYAYLNINNLSAFPYTFQQGVIEQRLLLDAMLELQIPQATLGACGAIATGAVHRFDGAKVVAGGQSMGGMYTNMTAPIEPRWTALVPTGAGGFWNFMILETMLVPGARSLLGTALGIDDEQLVFAHPALAVLGLGWEAAEPIAFMNRINARRLPSVGARDIYQSVPKDDENFTTSVYDAAVLSTRNQQAGTVVWPELQTALGLDDLDGLAAYPVKGNLDGATRVAVQFEGDGIEDPHYIFQQLDEVKHQYGCFLFTHLRDGVATVPAPGALTDPCE
ncbi:MAG: hypothetical protein ACKV2T_34640 [Kofleriaceae bacterium]